MTTGCDDLAQENCDTGSSNTTAVSTHAPNEAQAPAVPQRWEDAVSAYREWAGAKAVYYRRPEVSPNALGFRLVLGEGDPCTIAQSPTRPRPINPTLAWDITIETPGDSGPQQASVSLTRVGGSIHPPMPARNAVVEVLQLDQTKSPARIRVTANFPVFPGWTRECGGTVTPEGKKIGGCTCFDGNSTSFSCDPIAKGYDCCAKHKLTDIYRQLGFEIANVTYCEFKG